jgi:hypothetical protein
MVPLSQSLENRSPEYLSNVVTLHFMSGMSANLCPFKAIFFILEKAKTAGGLSQVNKVDVSFILAISI